MNDTTHVSVVVATRDRASLLAQMLDALAAQTWPHGRLEIVVADNGSTDGTPGVVETAAARPDGPAVRCPGCGDAAANPGPAADRIHSSQPR